jgi:hypothetical protein
MAVLHSNLDRTDHDQKGGERDQSRGREEERRRGR